MEIASLAYRTDLMFARFDGIVEERADYLVVRSPRNPGFYWGTYLLFDRPPGVDDVVRWPALFAHELAGDPRIGHIALGWDAPDGDRGAAEHFVDEGFDLNDDLVMTMDAADAAAAAPARPCRGLEIRALRGHDDWQAMTALSHACDPEEGDAAPYQLFKKRLRDRYRAMVEAGRGVWLGGFLGGRLVGQLGLFRDGALGRFQSVETHPDMRRQGVCSALVRHAIRLGLGELGARRLVVVAAEDYHAKDIYRAAGFAVVQRQLGLCRPAGPAWG